MEWDKLVLGLGAKDPIFFANYFLGVKLNNFQKRALLAFSKHKQNLFVTANQVGKTVSLAILHIWTNFYKRGIEGEAEMIERTRFETLNISPVLRQSKEAWRYIIEILEGNWTWEEDGKRVINKCLIPWFLEGRNEMAGRIDFFNNASVFCLSTSEDQGSGLAGKQFAFTSYDECVQSLHLEQELPARIFSRTAKYSGPVLLVATPDDLAKSQQYWYHLYTEAEQGKGSWNLVKGLYDDNIFIPEKIREDYKSRLKELSPERYKQVVLGQFVASQDRMFSPEVVEGMWNGKRELTTPIPNHQYLEIIDWGVADSGDETVIYICDITELTKAEIVLAWARKGGDPIELIAMAGYLKNDYNDAEMLMDAGSMGGTMFKKMMTRFNPIAFPKEAKADALISLQVRLRNNLRKDLTNSEKSGDNGLKSYYLPKLEEQLSIYKIEDKRIKQDWVMVAAMLAWFLQKIETKKLKTFDIKYFYKV